MFALLTEIKLHALLRIDNDYHLDLCRWPLYIQRNFLWIGIMALSMDKLTISASALAISISVIFSGSALAGEEPISAPQRQGEIFGAEVFGNLRTGFISAKDDAGDRSHGSAFGGKLGIVSDRWHGLSAGATAYMTQELFDDENGDFFGSDGSGYVILGEAFVQAKFANTEFKLGRFEFDSPHADTDDIRMVPNTFSGVLVTNGDIEDMTLYLAHLDRWAGVDTDEPEHFKEMNGDEGITTVGALYQGFDNLGLQAWYYTGSDFADLVYLEAIYETDSFSVGAQFGSQSDDTPDSSGPDGDVYGFMASYTIDDFTLMSAYNSVDGVVVNGFGGGPFFTSSDDHTVEGEPDQKALALGLEYAGFDGLTLGVLNVNFDKHQDETDFYAAYDMQDNMSVELIYHDMNDDGSSVRMMFNMGF